MRVGLVCPYSFDIPGGVQAHVADLARTLISLGHHVSVLAPGDDSDGPTEPGQGAARGAPAEEQRGPDHEQGCGERQFPDRRHRGRTYHRLHPSYPNRRAA